MKRRRLLRQLAILIALIALVIAAIFIYSLNDKPPVVPSVIQKQVNFAIFYPQPSQTIIIDKNTFKYDKSIGQVSFIVDFSNQHITFAEQSTPDNFSSSADVYSNFIGKLDGYATFNSVDGQVNLTLPPQVGSETGVMNAKGTLLFAKSSGNISESNWKLLFNSLHYIQPN